MAGKKSQKSSNIWQRLLPALIFIAGLSVLVILFYDTNNKKTPSHSTTEQTVTARYNKAKDIFESLKGQEDVSLKRWHSLAEEFYAIYEEYPQWPNRPAALFRNALVIENIAKSIKNNEDLYLLAVERYIKLANEFVHSRLADDALLQAAIVQSKALKNNHSALKLLQYIRTTLPKGDMYAKAKNLEDKLNAEFMASKKRQHLEQKGAVQKVKLAKNAFLKEVSWKTIDKETVQIIAVLDKNITWKVVKNKGAQIQLTMDNTIPVKNMLQGARVKDSLLTKLAVTQAPKGKTALLLDFAADPHYEAKIELNPYVIVLTVKSKKVEKSPQKPTIMAVAETNNTKEASKLVSPPAQKEPTKKPAQVAIKKQEDISPKQKNPVENTKNSTKSTAAKNTQTKAKDNAKQTPLAKQESTKKQEQLTAAELSKKMNKANTDDMAMQLGLSVQTVFIDIGHGGRDPGAIGFGLVERDVVLDIGLRLGKILQDEGLQVVYSRTTDKAVPLSSRAQIANKARGDLFVSIHVNANTDKRVHGFETYYLNFAKTPQEAQTAALENATSDRKLGDIQDLLAKVMLNVRTTESSDFASHVQQAAIEQLRNAGYSTKDGGKRSAPFHVLIGTNMPGILVEVGYCSNKDEANLLKQSKYRANIAKGIANGILNYKNRFEKGESLHFALTNNDDDAM